MDLLSQALLREVDPEPDPFVQAWPGRRSLALEVGVLAVPIVGITVTALFAGISFEPEVIAFIAVMLVLAASFPVRAHLFGIRRLLVDSDGIETMTARRSERTHWAQVSRIEARNDLERVRLLAQGGPREIDLSRLGVNERLAVIDALRAHARGTPVGPWTDAGRRFRQAALPVLSGVLFLFVAGAFFEDYVGYSMGMRCSGPSSYMHDRFDVPDGAGCIVIGVSGAAERAGLRQGDKIIAQDGHPITSGPQFHARFFDEDTGPLAVPARKMRLTVLRGGEPKPLDITLTLGPGGGIDLPEDDPLYWFRKARAREGGEPAKGIAEYTRAIELAPEFDLAYLYRGDLYYWELRDSQTAWADYRRALELNPEHAEAHRAMGWLWSGGSGDDLDRAMTHAREAIRIDGCEGGFERYNLDCRYDYLLLADLHESLGDAAGAAAARRAADSFYPD